MKTAIYLLILSNNLGMMPLTFSKEMGVKNLCYYSLMLLHYYERTSCMRNVSCSCYMKTVVYVLIFHFLVIIAVYPFC